LTFKDITIISGMRMRIVPLKISDGIECNNLFFQAVITHQRFYHT
jgi:hypothetical protein